MFTLITLLTGNDPERLRNFKIWYNYYTHHFKDANIIVVSQNDHPDLTDFVVQKHIKFETNKKLFNRSKCINNGVKASDTEKCIVLDSDILIPKENIEFFLGELDNHNFCIPYNYCMNLSEDETKSVDIDNLTGGTIRMSKNVSKGGVLFCNKSKFLQIKGYNENFWGWGAEDDAFFYVVQTLDKIHRPDNDYKIYHLNHKRVGGTNPHYIINYKLLIMIANMNKEQLIKFLKIEGV